MHPTVRRNLQETCQVTAEIIKDTNTHSETHSLNEFQTKVQSLSQEAVVLQTHFKNLKPSKYVEMQMFMNQRSSSSTSQETPIKNF